MEPWVIAGCGYVGGYLARTLRADGAHVVCVGRRREAVEAAMAGATGPGTLAVRIADLSVAGALDGQIPAGAVIAVCVPPAAGLDPAALVFAAAAAGARRIIYLSSTGVYPRGRPGAVTDEDTAPAPIAAHGAARLSAERSLLAAATEARISAIALRVAAIYGPHRGVHARLLAGTYRIVGDGRTRVSRIHVDDLVAVIRAAAGISQPPRSIYNVADDVPMGSRALADEVAALLGLPSPPSVPMAEVSVAAQAMLTADRHIDNRRIKGELGVTLRYPEPMAGIRQAIAEMRAASS